MPLTSWIVDAPVAARAGRRARAAALAVGCAPLVALPAAARADTAYVMSGSRVVAFDPASGTPRMSTSVSERSTSRLVVTPDGATVYVSGIDVVTPITTATGAAGTPIRVRDDGNGLAITPDGATVFVSSTAAGTVTPIATATNTPGAPVTVDHPTGLAVTPDGHTAYVLTGSGAALTPIDLTTGTAGTPIGLGHDARAVAITPDGARAIVAERDATSGFVQVVDLATRTAEPQVALTDLFPSIVAVTPDGRTAYLAGRSTTTSTTGTAPAPDVLRPFVVATRAAGSPIQAYLASYGVFGGLAVTGDAGQLLATVTCNDMHCVSSSIADISTATNTFTRSVGSAAQVASGALRGPEAIVVAPSPSAAFTPTAAQIGAPSTFDASASGDAGGQVTDYAWQFGDGTPGQSSPSPVASHVYRDPGIYTVALTTANTGGCAARLAFTGQSASCSGRPDARTTRTVLVSAPAATPSTGPATARTTSRATLNGTIQGTGPAVAWRFRYGPTTDYGSSTAVARLPGGDARTPVRVAVRGLVPNTVYHYRLVAETSEGSAAAPVIRAGGDATFRTAATATLRLPARILALTDRVARVPLRCAGLVPCTGRLVLTARVRTGGGHRLETVSCAGTPVRVPAGRTVRRSIAVTPACRSRLRRAAGHRLAVTVTATLSPGQRGFTAVVTLRG